MTEQGTEKDGWEYKRTSNDFHFRRIQTTETNLEEEHDTLERLLDSIYNGTVVEE